MPKDATKNVDRYKVRGGTLNEYEFEQGKTADKKQQATDKTPQNSTAKKASKEKTSKKASKKNTSKKASKKNTSKKASKKR
jgi:hypothetical protein